MKKNLKLLISFVIIFLTFEIPQNSWSMETHSSVIPVSVLKKYDKANKVTYTSSEFKSDQNEDGHFFTHPCKPQNPRKERVLIYEKKPQELYFERALKRVKPGEDGRERIKDTTKWPYSICTQISMVFDDKQYGGSGTLIGPHHILTAAHNVYDTEKKIWATSIEIYPALNEEAAPFGSAEVTRIYTFKEWISNGNLHYDCAILVLDQSIGLYTGWGGIFCLQDNEEIISRKVSITGYPGDKSFNQMWTMKYKIKDTEAEIFSYEIDTYGGQSGSGIWTYQGSDPYIMGVHTLGSTSLNYGVRLSKNKYDAIVKGWLSETRDIQQQIPKQNSFSQQMGEPRSFKRSRNSDQGSSTSAKRIHKDAEILKDRYLNIPSELSKKALLGDREARFEAIIAYAKINGVGDEEEAITSWYHKKANSGDPDAQNSLGLIYALGKGVRKNESLAVKLYLESAQQKYAPAEHNLGWMYANGRGVAKNDDLAVYYYSRAAEQGYALSQHNLGVRHSNNQDYGSAFKWFLRAAEQGHAQSQLMVGVMYASGQGIDRNDSGNDRLAVDWYRKSAAQGNSEAQLKLGIRYFNGEGITRDNSLAFKWYHESEKQGNSEAQFKLGKMYANGLGVGKDEHKAISFYRLAADKGHAEAQFNLGIMYQNGYGVEKNEDEALFFFGLAKDQGHEAAHSCIEEINFQYKMDID